MDNISSEDGSFSGDDSTSGVDSTSRVDSTSGVDSNGTDVPSAIDDFNQKNTTTSVAYSNSDNIKSILDYSIESMDVLINMEVLEESWRDSIISAQEYWKRNSNDTQICKSAMFPDSNTEFIFQKIFESLLYTYFCGAVYDGQIYARAMIAVQSTRWLMMLYYANNCKDLNSIIYLYSREVEHSDLNVDALIEHFENELIY
jgi:hypothetical protein